MGSHSQSDVLSRWCSFSSLYKVKGALTSVKTMINSSVCKDLDQLKCTFLDTQEARKMLFFQL